MKIKYVLSIMIILWISISWTFVQSSVAQYFDGINESRTDMVYKGSTVLTTSIPVGKGESNERIIAVRVETEGSENPLELTVLEFSLTGTTRLADIDSLKVYYTAGSPRLSTDHLFGTAAVQEGTITVTGSQVLNEGFNHFWVTADLSTTAEEGNFIKGEIQTVTVGGHHHRRFRLFWSQ